MRRIGMLLLSLLLVGSLFYNVQAGTAKAANMTTEQKYAVLKDAGIFTGFADGSSRLYESMTREQFAVTLYRLFQLSDPGYSVTSSYDDVLRTRWSFKEVEAITRAGLMSGVGNRKFAPDDPVTIEQLATVLVRALGYTSNNYAFVNGKVSSWARTSVRIALDSGWISQTSDYTVNATRGLLVEALYGVYDKTRVEPIQIQSVVAASDRSIIVTLQQPVTKLTDDRFGLRDIYGHNLRVGVSSLSYDGKTILLWTDRMIGGVYHTLVVDGKDLSMFLSIPEDTTKPQVSSVYKLSNKQIRVIFNEKVDSNSATNSNNYQFNNGLRINKIELASDQQTVTLTTGDQVDGRNYQLTIKGVRDVAGNTMDTYNGFSFTGNNDTVKPKVTSVQINATATLTVKFSEKIDPSSAKSLGNYSLDKGLRVTGVTLNADGSSVTLQTSKQQDAVLYTLTVSGIPDLAGNVMDTSTNWMFGGISNPEVPVTFQSIKAINNNTVELSFSRDITDSDVAKLKLNIVSDNGNAVSMTDWQQFVSRKDSKTVTVQYRTKNSNPDLFRPGHVYVAKVSGVVSLVTSDDKDQLPFAGTETGNPAPYVSKVTTLGDDRIKVYFSEPVTNVDETAFSLGHVVGNGDDYTVDAFITIDYDELNDTNGVVTDVVLKLKGKLQRGHRYVLGEGDDSFTDTAKWNEWGSPDTYLFTANW